MGGKLGFGGRVVVAALLAGALLFFGTVRTVTADDAQSWTVAIGNAADTPEGDSAGANSMTFPLTLTELSGTGTTNAAITVTYTSSEGIVSPFLIPKGTAAGTVNMPVAVNGNTTAEDDRTMKVDLTNATIDPSDTTDAASLGSPTEGTGKIIDDDWRISGLTSDPANASASEAGGVIDFKVTLNANAPTNHAISVDYALTDGTGAMGAKFGTNYTVTQPTAGKQKDTLTFAPGKNVVDVKVQGKNDGVYGYDKAFTMTISNPQGASFGAGATTSENGTITEASAPPVIAIESACGSVVGGNAVTIPIDTSYASPIPASVTWTTASGSAVSGDYDGGSGTATVPAGTREASITIQTHENPPPGNRTFSVTLSNAQHATLLGSAASTTCTVQQPQSAGTDKLPSLQLTDPAPVPQPAAGGSPVAVPITVTLNPPVITPSTPGPVDVQWQTKDGTAVAPADYTTATGKLHWDAGTYGSKQLSPTIMVNPANGTSSTPLKFTITFTTTSAGFVSSNAITVTVVPPSSPPVLSVSDASGFESAGSIPVVVSLAPSSTNQVTVQYGTIDGSASAGSDYTTVSGTLTFAPGQVSKTVLVPVTNDNQVEPTRSFTFRLSNPTNATIGTAAATVTIRDDDAPTPAPPILNGGGPAPPQKTPQQLPTKQAPAKHVVLVQVLTGQSAVDAKGYAHFKLSCPVPAVKACQGTIVLQVRVAAKKTKGAKKDPPPATVTIATGKFKIKVTKTASVKLKVTKAGLGLLKSYKRIKVKATVRATDAQKVKGVTAWFVTVQAPERAITIKTK